MKEFEIITELQRFLKRDFSAMRVTGDPGLSGHFALYTPVPGNPGCMTMVGRNFHVDSDAGFHHEELPQSALLSRPKKKRT